MSDSLSTAIAPPPTFLSLAPTVSASYPVRKASVTSSTPPATSTTSEAEGATLHRRSSSSASTGSSAGTMRFLKLGPVHWGEGDGQGDWSDVAAVSPTS